MTLVAVSLAMGLLFGQLVVPRAATAVAARSTR